MKANKKYIAPDGFEYFMCPMTKFVITQVENVGTHKGTKAVDFASGTAGYRAPYYAPATVKCIEAIPSHGEATWQTVNKVHCPNGYFGIVTFITVHDNSFNSYVGQVVPQGVQLGNMGDKGNASGVHLHYENAQSSNGRCHYNSYNIYTLVASESYVDDTWYMDDTEIVTPMQGNWRKIPQNNFNVKDLIQEDGVAKLTVDQVAIRKGNPINGGVVKRVNTGHKQRYTHKWVGNGHRYVAWKEKSVWYFMAVSGSEVQGKDQWATIEIEEKPSYKVEKETYAIRLKVDGIRVRKEPTKNAKVISTLNTGDEREYIAKTINDGHRWVQLKDKNWVAITPKEEISEEWVDLIDPKDMEVNKPQESEKPTEPPKEPEKPAEPPKIDKNVKAWGVDISEHNGNFDVKGQDFIIIRATWGTNTDKLFLQNVKKCQDNKIPFGVYCYSYAIDDDGAISEADYIMKLLQDNNIVPTVGVWFDMEDADGYKAKNNALDKTKITRWCKLFCDKLSNQGYYTGVYSNTDWFGRLVETDYPRWYANWGTNDGTLQNDFSSLENVVLHQYSSNPIDKNCSYVELDTFKSNPKPIEQEKPQEDNPIEQENIGLFNQFLKIFIALGEFLLKLFGLKK